MFECLRQGINADPGPPRGFIAVTVQITVVQPADRDCVFVAGLAVERTRLSKANVVRFGGRAAADDAGLRDDEFAVLLVARLAPNGAKTNHQRPASSTFE